MLDAEEILKDAMSWVNFDRNDLVPELRAFGEDDVADKFVDLDDRAVEAIGVLASKHYSTPERPVLDKAICLAIVEFIEGQPRPLKRKRRIYPKS